MNRRNLATGAVLTALLPVATAVTGWSSTAQATTADDCGSDLKTLYHTNMTYWYTDTNGKEQQVTSDVAGWVELRKSHCGVKAYVSLTGGTHFTGGELTGRVFSSPDGGDGASNIDEQICGLDGAVPGAWCATGFISPDGVFSRAVGRVENNYPVTHGYAGETPRY
ncbi:hypothetical protein FraEuI1c_7176 [Pseudofrankia inefficax]|uniref:Secreted protein n=1 Tax=Pseudofrankia inefficax (strain DSM 45817 / CECT 9037 / DDB 130130 / EuI1c) TaxID=298654 RepID=E3IZU8_PSEI1|nr:hypothetical protein FraEuI1c_7176 [Pseudofrankia inefficax]